MNNFAELMTRAGFDEAGMRELLKATDVSNFWGAGRASYLYRCQHEDSPRSHLAAFWLLGQTRPRALLESLMGSETLAWLREQGIVHGQAELRSGFDMTPCLGRYILHDLRLSDRDIVNRVYSIGGDSYTLARVTPRKRARRALDLCTGSGIHAVMAARDHDEVVGVDLNPRAIQVSQFNAELNGVADKCRFLLGDLYAPVAGETFDLITINPPFVSTPQKEMEIHRTGGETGEEISSRAVAELPHYLRPGGIFSMVLSYPVMRDSTYLGRLSGWLGRSRGWGIAVINTGELKNEQYIASHHRPHAGEDGDVLTYEAYLESYERLGILKIGFANVFICRLAEDHPGYCIEHSIGFPMDDLSEAMQAFLEAQEHYHDPRRLGEGAPRTNATIWVDGADALLEPLPNRLGSALSVSTDLALRLDGHHALNRDEIARLGAAMLLQ